MAGYAEWRRRRARARVYGRSPASLLPPQGTRAPLLLVYRLLKQYIMIYHNDDEKRNDNND